MKYIIVSIYKGEVIFVSQAKTRKGAEISAKGAMGRDTEVRILSIDDILKWDSDGTAELEALYRL